MFAACNQHAWGACYLLGNRCTKVAANLLKMDAPKKEPKKGKGAAADGGAAA